jgi:hypothetical protein
MLQRRVAQRVQGALPVHQITSNLAFGDFVLTILEALAVRFRQRFSFACESVAP